KVTVSGTPSNNVVAEIGTTFVADTDAQAPLSNGAGIEALNTGATAYNKVAWIVGSWNATDEEERRQLTLGTTLHNLYIRLSAAPGVGKSWVFTVRRNNTDTALTVTISGTDTTGSDTSNEAVFVDDDYMSLSCTPSGTPAAANARWGVYQILGANLPTVTTQTCENVVGTTATGRGNITDLGTPNPTAHGHCWDTSINPTTSDSSVDNGAASVTGAFTSAITALIPGTGYFTRAFATNAAGTAYGANVFFIASTARKGYTWDEDSNLRSFDENAIERQYIHTDDVDDVAVNGATTDPISSNWAFDHVAAADPHTGYVLESLLDAKGDLYVASADDTVAKLTVGSNNEYLVAASGESTGLKWQTIPATDVEVSELSTATYDDVQDYMNFQGDRTLFTGGVFTDNGDGTVT
ncbi:hypothetical protein LCGC14_2802600, partial [marine sediment metagenome]